MPIVPIAVDWVDFVIFMFIIGSSLIGKLLQANNQRLQRKKKTVVIPPPRPDQRAGPRRGSEMAGRPELRDQPAGGGRPMADVEANRPRVGGQEDRLDGSPMVAAGKFVMTRQMRNFRRATELTRHHNQRVV